MEKTNFTIIIPHYNIPDLLMRCLKSIPIREDIQVIVVDDCSPNAETYKLTYPELSRPFLEYYSTVKGGSAGRARNVGLDHARGKWILFADADDFFENGFMSTLNSYLNSEADVVIFDYRSVLSVICRFHLKEIIAIVLFFIIILKVTFMHVHIFLVL